MKYVKIGQKIREQRQRQGYTQQQLADDIGVTWEMVSRYERGDSSPLNRIEALAQALKVSPLELLQEYFKSSDSSNIDTMMNNIPLFIKLPQPMKFDKESTTYFYNAPVWITQRDKEAFAVEYDVVISKTAKIPDQSILYISPNAQIVESSIVLYEKGDKLICDLYSKVEKGIKIIGVVVAQEIRL